MRLIDIFITASGNMFRSKLRTSLTVVAIFIGSFTLTLTTGLGTGISSYIDKQVANLGAKDVMLIQAGDPSGAGGPSDNSPKSYDPSKKVSATAFGTTTTVLTNADIAKIKQIPGITSVEPNLVVTPDYIEGANGKKYQVSANPYITGTNIDLASGQQLSNTTDEKDALLPVEFVSALGYSSNQAAIGQQITLGISDGTGKQYSVIATIKGVQQKGLTNSGGMNTNDALTKALFKQQTIGLPPAASNSYEALVAKFDDSYTDSQITTLKNTLKDRGYKGMTFEDEIGSFKQVISGIILVLDAFAVIALLAASFGIINTLLMSVQERTKEIGLMKAMGMSGSRIFLLFSAEAVMLGLWGSLIGAGMAIIVGHIADIVVTQKFLKDLVGLHLLTFQPASIAVIVGIVMVIAFLAGTLPAFRAARQSPIDSLRYE